MTTYLNKLYSRIETRHATTTYKEVRVFFTINSFIGYLSGLSPRTELEERDLHVDHCNQVLQETQGHYSKLAQENGAIKTEIEKLERVMLMQVGRLGWFDLPWILPYFDWNVSSLLGWTNCCAKHGQEAPAAWDRIQRFGTSGTSRMVTNEKKPTSRYFDGGLLVYNSHLILLNQGSLQVSRRREEDLGGRKAKFRARQGRFGRGSSNCPRGAEDDLRGNGSGGG